MLLRVWVQAKAAECKPQQVALNEDVELDYFDRLDLGRLRRSLHKVGAVLDRQLLKPGRQGTGAGPASCTCRGMRRGAKEASSKKKRPRRVFLVQGPGWKLLTCITVWPPTRAVPSISNEEGLPLAR